MSTAEAVLSEVLEAFDFGNPVVGAMRFGYGHINDTFCVHTQPKDECCRCFILQRMSSAAFKHPDQLMSNIIGVTEYLGKKITAAGGDRSREAMEVIRPRSGEAYYTDSQTGTRTVDKVFDLQESTFWQTAEGDALPHTIVIDLGSEQTLTGLEYLPRAEAGAPGSVKGYSIYVYN